MTRLFLSLVLFIGIVGPAATKNPFEELNQALGQINDALKGALSTEQQGSPSNTTTTTKGTCVAINHARKPIIREPCTAKAVCNDRGDCDVRCVIGKMYIEAKFNSGKLIEFWQQKASWTNFEGHACMLGDRSQIALCFLTDESASADREIQTDQNRQSGSAAPVTKDEEPNEDTEFSRWFRDYFEKKRDADALRVLEEVKAIEEAEAKLAEKRRLIDEVIAPEEIERFFEGKTRKTLSPIEAKAACREYFLGEIAAIESPVPSEMLKPLRERCAMAGDKYAKREAELAGERYAQKILAEKADLSSLRTHNWFLIDSDRMTDFSALQITWASKVFRSVTASHRKAAIKSAEVEIKAKFRSANPLTNSAVQARQICNLPTRAPLELRSVCSSELSKFSERTAVARCRQSIEQSSVSQKLLRMPFAVSGVAIVSSPLQQVICAGVRNRPQYRIIVNESWFSGLTPTTLTIIEGAHRKVLEVELRISSPRDGRSFTQLLIDIATGENEKPVYKELVVSKVTFAGKGVRGREKKSVVGCTLGFIRCR